MAAVAGGFSPESLFANGEQGVWYDPSDLTTLFQDAAGTTPVTAMEQPVGLVLDKSGNGNHAKQTTAASRPVVSARYNLLTYTEQFDNAAWNSGANAIAANVGGGAFSLQDNNTGLFMFKEQAVGSVPAGTAITFRVMVKKTDTAVYPLFRLKVGTNIDRIFNTQNGAVNIESGVTVVTDPTDSTYWLFTFTATMSSTTTPVIELYPAASTDGSTLAASVTGITTFKYPDLRVSNDGVGLPAYQRVGASTDYDTTGFPVYLRFDGGDSFATASINFTATDKMSVFAGVRKIDDTQQRVIAELSASILSNNGMFLLDGPTTTSPNYRFASKGTSLSLAETPLQYPAPTTDILTGLADISADGCVMRVDGIQVNSSTADQGTGNYGNYPLYIGARGGTALFFTGRLYGLLVIGRALTATEITNTENYMEAKTFGKDMAYVYSDELTTATGDLITAADGDQIYMSVNYQ